MTSVEKIVVPRSSLGRGATPWGGPMGKRCGGSGGRARGDPDERFCWGFCGKEWVRQGKQAWDGLVGIISVGLGCRGCSESGTHCGGRVIGAGESRSGV